MLGNYLIKVNRACVRTCTEHVSCESFLCEVWSTHTTVICSGDVSPSATLTREIAASQWMKIRHDDDAISSTRVTTRL